MNLDTIKKTFTPRYLILLLTIWQFFSVLLMALGVWPLWVVWINLIMSLLFILFTDSFFSLLFLIISIPFYTALPNSSFSSLSSWRILFFFCLGVWIFRQTRGKSLREFIKSINFFPWDKYLALFLLVSVVTKKARDICPREKSLWTL